EGGIGGVQINQGDESVGRARRGRPASILAEELRAIGGAGVGHQAGVAAAEQVGGRLAEQRVEIGQPVGDGLGDVVGVVGKQTDVLVGGGFAGEGVEVGQAIGDGVVHVVAGIGQERVERVAQGVGQRSRRQAIGHGFGNVGGIVGEQAD